MNRKELIIEFIETLVTSFVVILVIYIFVAAVEVVSGASMEPNFYTGERILVEKVTKYVKPFSRGEIVVVFPPSGEKKHLIKRLIGMPGDIIKIVGCNVEISTGGEQFLLKEDYLDKDTCSRANSGFLKEGRSIKLQADEYLVLGDNRGVSVDSRSFGPVKKDQIVGRVVFRFWPLLRLGFIV